MCKRPQEIGRQTAELGVITVYKDEASLPVEEGNIYPLPRCDGDLEGRIHFLYIQVYNNSARSWKPSMFSSARLIV